MSLLDQFYGNSKAKEALVFYQRDGRFPHGILLEGQEGCGRRTFARLIAAAALCEGEDAPCGRCRHCRKILKEIHPDVQLIAPEPGKKSFKKEQVERLRADAWVKPNEAPRKIYILCETQYMTAWAQNALLKLLEEPPAGVLFLLTCDNRFKLLETVRSRVVALTLEAPGEELAEKALLEQVPALTQQQARLAAMESSGNVGRAKRLLADEGYAAVMDKAAALCEKMEKADWFGILQVLSGFESDREGLLQCLEQVRQLLAQNTKDSFFAKKDRQYRILPLQAGQVLGIIEQGMEYARQNMGMPLLTTWLGAGIGSAFEK
ncbi:MAG: DNA polymerase III subunit [Oscillospiraceae bacterium]|nr:DNA polymerase III subunit [Oscillospiraceae bacterium]